MNHRIGRTVFALGVGILVAWYSYQWITNPAGREQRARQVAVIEASQRVLRATLDLETLEIVDPLNPNRKVGKVYVYPEEGDWSVSGYYRRDEGDKWHPYLMRLDPDRNLRHLKIQDTDVRLIELAANTPELEVSR